MGKDVFSLNYTNLDNDADDKRIKAEIKNPFGNKVTMEEGTWRYHVIGTHPERNFYSDEFNFNQILGSISKPKIIVADKDFSKDFLRLNYFSPILVRHDGKIKLKTVKIVTEADGSIVENLDDSEDISTWNYENFVTAIVQTKVDDDFSERRIYYVQNCGNGYGAK